jgi:hypothetical protein
MLAGILFLTLIVVVAALITVDVARTPTEAPAGQAHGHGPERAIVGARASTGVSAFPREPPGPDKAPLPAAGGARFGTGPAEMDSVGRPDEAARTFDQMRQEMSQSAASDAALRGRFNAISVNLSRRSQSLVERQLRLIESLEYGEQDQQRLANLARLNRIAMRMHRNSQNLLVLAGQEPVSNWNQPVTLAHLVEAALAEIEDDERVSFEVQPDIALRGPAVHDTVHLLVELIDNATSFSASEMPVHITGRILTTGGALVDITDRGIGMPAKEMAYANQQLDYPPPPGIDVPKWMGLLVVARLASRHGIRVRLNPAELGGLTALVWLPDEILTHYAGPSDPGRGVAEQRGAAVGGTAFAGARINMSAASARPVPAWSAPVPPPVPAEPLVAARLAVPTLADATSGNFGMVMPDTDSQAIRRLPIFDEVESRWSRGGREATGARGSVTSPSPVASPGPSASPCPVASPGPSAPPGPITAAGSLASPGPVPSPGPASASPGPASASPGPAAAPGPVASPGPASADPALSDPAAPELPRRPSPSAAGPRAVPGSPPGTPNRPGAPARDPRTGVQRGGSPGWAGPADEVNPDGQEES